jgi:NAD(P)-dependent dehydrogenase (short-subunit alcohol dehydrogenase family)
MSKLEGKIALVTGATRGIGKGIAIGLAEAGATVYITGRSLNTSTELEGNLQETSEAIEKAGGKCIFVQVDHSNDAEIEHLFQKIETEQQGQLDILVNNVYGGVKALRENQGKPFWEADIGLWDACNHVGLRSHYLASYFAAKMMTKRKQGLICTISSWGGISYIFNAPYGAGKAGCDRLAADLAVELKPYNVASISLWPGIVGTEHISQLAEEIKAQKTPDPRSLSISEGYNWETPLLTGRVIAALGMEPKIMRLTGSTQIVAELAQRYRLVDSNGDRPISLRSLRFLLPFTIPFLRNYSFLIPDWRFPWFLLLLIDLPSPKLKN